MPETKSEKEIFLGASIERVLETFKSVFSSPDLEEFETNQDQGHLQDYLAPSRRPLHLNNSQVNFIQAHSSLPILLLGGKGLIEVCRFDTLEHYNRVACPGVK